MSNFCLGKLAGITSYEHKMKTVSPGGPARCGLAGLHMSDKDGVVLLDSDDIQIYKFLNLMKLLKDHGK